MLPDLQSSLLCDDVRQEINGKLILVGTFDFLGAGQLPLRYPRLFIVNRWCSGQGEFLQRSRILAPDQSTQVVSGAPIPIRLPDATATVTNMEVFLNVQFQQAGVYWVEILLQNQLKLRYPLRVMLTRPPPGPVPPAPGTPESRPD